LARGDSACHENDLLAWLKHPDRAHQAQAGVSGEVSDRFHIMKLMNEKRDELRRATEPQQQTEAESRRPL
jgi:hypothetical protein